MSRNVVLGLILFVTATSSWAETLRWYRGNTHTHTLNSDGDSTPDVVARWYREHGYQFLFITDHEYVTDVGPLNAMLGGTERFLVLPGQEVTQWSLDPTRASSRVSAQIGAPAHVNALFSKEVVWPIGGTPPCSFGGCGANAPESMPYGKTFKPNIEAIRAQGGFAQINHPNLLWAGRPEDLAEVPDGTLIEIWNGVANAVHNLGGADGSGDLRPAAEGYWDWLLSRGKVIWGVGSDDSHRFKTEAILKDPNRFEAGRAWIVVRAARLTAQHLKAAMAKGDFYASTGVALDDVVHDHRQFTVTIKPEAMPLSSWLPPRYSTKFIGQGGAVLATVAGVKATYSFNRKEQYVRAVVTDSNGRQAWTQPVFLDGRNRK